MYNQLRNIANRLKKLGAANLASLILRSTNADNSVEGYKQLLNQQFDVAKELDRLSRTNIEALNLASCACDIVSKYCPTSAANDLLIGMITSVTGGSNGGSDDDSVWVDLGLPSGTLWRKTNVGATNPEDDGYWYAMCEPYTKSAFAARGLCLIASEINYAGGMNPVSYGMDDNFLGVNLTQCAGWRFDGKYDGAIRNTDSLMSLDVFGGTVTYTSNKKRKIIKNIFDPAYVVLGNDSIMPIGRQYDELYENCESHCKTINNKKCIELTSLTNGNSIIFPLSGSMSGAALYSDSFNATPQNIITDQLNLPRGTTIPGVAMLTKDAFDYTASVGGNPQEVVTCLNGYEEEDAVIKTLPTYGNGTMGCQVRAVKMPDGYSDTSDVSYEDDVRLGANVEYAHMDAID